MFCRSALLLVLLALLLAPFARGQGSAGGYGQGGGSESRGSMAGGRAGDADDPAPEAPRPETGPGWTGKTAVLTPGDRVEYKFEVKAGETLLASASSDAFDPALAVVDAAGKELARNDDRAEGDQSPFVAVRFPADGTYTLRVLSYRSAAGGKFAVRFRTLRAPDAIVGRTTVEIPPAERNDPTNDRATLRIAAKKGETYEVRVRGLDGRNRANDLSYLGAFGATGVFANDLETIVTPTNWPILRAIRDGDAYVEFYRGGLTRLDVEVRLVATTTIGTSGEATIEFKGDEVRLVEFPVKNGTIVHTTLLGADLRSRVVAPMDPDAPRGQGDAAYGRTAMWTYFLLNRDDVHDVVRIFRAEGTARVAIATSGNEPRKVTVRNTDALPDWIDGTTRPTIAIGESKLYLWRAKPAELARVSAKSETFQARLDIFTLEGEVANTLMDRGRRVAADDLYFPNGGVYIVRLTCDGFGGSGVATLSKGAIPSSPYTLGAVTKIALDGQNYGLYEVELQAGQRYALTISDPGAGTRVDLLDETGLFLYSPAVRFEKVAVYYFVPERTGRHRLWLRGNGSRTFRFERYSAPDLGSPKG